MQISYNVIKLTNGLSVVQFKYQNGLILNVLLLAKGTRSSESILEDYNFIGDKDIFYENMSCIFRSYIFIGIGSLNPLNAYSVPNFYSISLFIQSFKDRFKDGSAKKLATFFEENFTSPKDILNQNLVGYRVKVGLNLKTNLFEKYVGSSKKYDVNYVLRVTSYSDTNKLLTLMNSDVDRFKKN